MKNKLIKIIGFLSLSLLVACATNQETKKMEQNKDESVVIEEEVQSLNDVTNIVLKGELTEQVIVNTTEDVEITLDSAKANMETSVISVKNANSVTFILKGENELVSTGQDVKTIDSCDDLIFKGDGTLIISSADTAIKSNDNLIIESGSFILNAQNGDGLRANETLTINGGNLEITANECLEATEVIINDGKLNLTGYDDGINASKKSDTKTPLLEINGGNITIIMGQGDTDALDSNGNLYINGGNIDITAQSPFDYDGEAQFNGGTLIVNGQETTQITNQMMGGPGMGGGQMPHGNMPNGNEEDGFSGNNQGMMPTDGHGFGGGPKGHH